MIDLKEIRSKSSPDIEKMLEDLVQEHFKLKLQAATGQLSNTSQFRNVKKDIARLRTILKEKLND
jgi:large subunit ribosomal protein L29|tara:strand:+ start:2924 stop:3118 length:195 start_codon:yes stop_codon:yes gene_type:complete